MIVKSVDRLDPVIHRTVYNLGWDNVEKEHSRASSLDDRQLPRHSFSTILTDLYIQVRDEALSNKLLMP